MDLNWIIPASVREISTFLFFLCDLLALNLLCAHFCFSVLKDIVFDELYQLAFFVFSVSI